MAEAETLAENTRTVWIHAGDVVAAAERVCIRTTLGSCISVCLRDPVTRVGGMNHFMLPMDGMERSASARYGVNAMELLINECMRQGADRQRLEAKAFGGGHVLASTMSPMSVPQINIRFIVGFLENERIPITSQDLGGRVARRLYYYTDSGRVLLNRIDIEDAQRMRALVALENEEQAKMRRLVRRTVEQDEHNITLF